MPQKALPLLHQRDNEYQFLSADSDSADSAGAGRAKHDSVMSSRMSMTSAGPSLCAVSGRAGIALMPFAGQSSGGWHGVEARQALNFRLHKYLQARVDALEDCGATMAEELTLQVGMRGGNRVTDGVGGELPDREAPDERSP